MLFSDPVTPFCLFRDSSVQLGMFAGIDDFIVIDLLPGGPSFEISLFHAGVAKVFLKPDLTPFVLVNVNLSIIGKPDPPMARTGMASAGLTGTMRARRPGIMASGVAGMMPPGMARTIAIVPMRAVMAMVMMEMVSMGEYKRENIEITNIDVRDMIRVRSDNGIIVVAEWYPADVVLVCDPAYVRGPPYVSGNPDPSVVRIIVP